MKSLLRFALALLAVTSPLLAEVKLGSPFTSHMVLQREMPVPIWGTAAPGEAVIVKFAGQKKTTVAGADGKWRVTLDALEASSEGRSFVVFGALTATPLQLDDVLVGEVWLASGQSNMVFPISKAHAPFAGLTNEAEEIAAANHPLVRMFTGKADGTYTPQETVKGEWLVATPANAPDFSAIGYFFARDLQKELNVPVGVITMAFGASCAHAWIRREAIEADPQLKPVLDQFDAQVKSFVPPTAQQLADWQKAVNAAKAAHKKPPGKPGNNPVTNQHNPTVLYNSLIAPIVPYAIRGVIWYQGESITDPKPLFPIFTATLISDWRKLWGSDLPFYFCQLAALQNPSNSPQVREWQAEALKIPGTAMAVTIDIGDPKNVHPKNKQAVGDRLSRIALAKNYDRKIEFSGPQFESATIDGSTIRVKFTHADGLTAKDGPLKTFEIAGIDGNYLPAEATISGDAVIVKNSAVTSPVTVRYAWANYPDGCNLINGAGLPAAPFRSDKQ